MILMEGVFERLGDGQTWADSPTPNPMTVEAALSTLVGHHVQFAMHHVPMLPFDPTKRGLGACYAVGRCHFGHDEGNTDLYQMTANGVLHQDPWRIEAFDGTVQTFDPSVLVGHMGRVACASVTELEKLRESAAKLTAQIQSFSIGCKVVGGE